MKYETKTAIFWLCALIFGFIIIGIIIYYNII